MPLANTLSTNGIVDREGLSVSALVELLDQLIEAVQHSQRLTVDQNGPLKILQGVRGSGDVLAIDPAPAWLEDTPDPWSDDQDDYQPNVSLFGTAPLIERVTTEAGGLYLTGVVAPAGTDSHYPLLFWNVDEDNPLTTSTFSLSHEDSSSTPENRLLLKEGTEVVLTGTTAGASPTLTGLSSTVGLFERMSVYGDNIPDGAHILSVDSATQVTLDQNATASGNGTLTFAGGFRAIERNDQAVLLYDFTVNRYRVWPTDGSWKQNTPLPQLSGQVDDWVPTSVDFASAPVVEQLTDSVVLTGVDGSRENVATTYPLVLWNDTGSTPFWLTHMDPASRAGNCLFISPYDNPVTLTMGTMVGNQTVIPGNYAGLNGMQANGGTVTAETSFSFSLTATTTASSSTATLTSSPQNAWVNSGMLISGTGIQDGTTTSSISGTTLTLSTPATASGSTTLEFSSTPSGSFGHGFTLLTFTNPPSSSGSLTFRTRYPVDRAAFLIYDLANEFWRVSIPLEGSAIQPGILTLQPQYLGAGAKCVDELRLPLSGNSSGGSDTASFSGPGPLDLGQAVRLVPGQTGTNTGIASNLSILVHTPGGQNFGNLLAGRAGFISRIDINAIPNDNGTVTTSADGASIGNMVVQFSLDSNTSNLSLSFSATGTGPLSSGLVRFDFDSAGSVVWAGQAFGVGSSKGVTGFGASGDQFIGGLFVASGGSSGITGTFP